MAEKSNRELLEELGVDVEQKQTPSFTPRQERIIAGFEDIQRFVEEHGHPPGHGKDKDIFERLYAARLQQLRGLTECKELVAPLDHQGLLQGAQQAADLDTEGSTDEELLAELGLAVDTQKEDDVTFLKHVKPRAEIRAAEEVAKRATCRDFDSFKPLFEKVQAQLGSGQRETRPFKDYAEVRQGDFFVLAGQKVYVAQVGEEFTQRHGKPDRRLRVIYDNGTESDLLLRSLQRALNKDKTARRIIDQSRGPLFSDEPEEDDLASGTIYVLRSQSEHRFVAQHREVIHKIGVTGGDVARRTANAKLDPTFLMADVEVVATYELYNINRAGLERLLHAFFAHTRLDIQIDDRFGNPVTPREWFLVPLPVIDEVVERIRNGTIGEFIYDKKSGRLVRVEG